jgi:conflict system pore-forming effector with SLATT domain
MFQVTVVDHIRLSFASVVSAYEGHAEAAARLARWGWHSRIAVLSLLAMACVAELLALQGGRPYLIAALAGSVLAFGACAAWVGLDLEPRIYAHRSSAAKLWLLCEQYRALLAEAQDQMLDARAIAERRDLLAREVRTVFEYAPPADRQTYEIARKALGGVKRAGYSDVEIDALLPPSLRRSKSEGT